MSVLGGVAEFICSIFGVTPERLDEIRAKTVTRDHRSTEQGPTENIIKTQMRYGWPTG